MTSLVSFVDNNKKKIGDFDKLPGGEARTQMLINLMMYLDSKSFIYFLKTSIFKNINNDKINAFINKIRYNLLFNNYSNENKLSSEENIIPNLPIYFACKIGIIENVKLIVNNYNINHSKFKTEKEFIEQDYNVKQYSEKCYNVGIESYVVVSTCFTVLMISVIKGHFDIIEYLILECKADSNKKLGRDTYNGNWNALHFAVSTFSKYKNINIIEILLKNMSSDAINQKTSGRENAPLDYAYHHKLDNNLIQLLRSNGCKANNFDVNGKYAYGKGDLND